MGDKKEWICRPVSAEAGAEIERVAGAEALRECRLGLVVAAVNEKEAKQFVVRDFEDSYAAPASEQWFVCEMDDDEDFAG